MFTDTEAIYQIYLTHSQVFTDTRHLAVGGIFFALKGANFDGNKYAQNALEKGAAYAVVDDPNVAVDKRFLLVEDVLLSLQDVARMHRKSFDFPVIALTGSNGKTTTKELIARVLSMKYNTYATKGNFNNHIGVPLTLLSVNPNKHEIAIIEMGANHQEEIALLCNIAQPTHGLITNIGKAHLEGFGGIKGIVKGKGELFDYLSKKKGIVFVNTQQEILMEMVSKRRAFGDIIFYPSINSHVNLELLESAPVVTYKTNAGKIVKTNLPGNYNFENMCTAVTVGYHFEVDEDDIHEAVATYTPDNNRSQFILKGSNRVLLDAYNANPSSMKATLESFALVSSERKIIILGDMLELGEETDEEHLKLGEFIASQKFDVVILTGILIQKALPVLPKAYYFPDKFSLHNWVMDNPQTNTHFLIKGSRGMALESIMGIMPDGK